MSPMYLYKQHMEEMRKHIVCIHNKDKWNWGLEIKAIFICVECEIEFTNKSILRSHIESGHTEVSGSIVEESEKKTRKYKYPYFTCIDQADHA